MKQCSLSQTQPRQSQNPPDGSRRRAHVHRDTACAVCCHARKEVEFSVTSVQKTQPLHLLPVSRNRGVCSFNQKRFIIAAETFFKVIYL